MKHNNFARIPSISGFGLQKQNENVASRRPMIIFINVGILAIEGIFERHLENHSTYDLIYKEVSRFFQF
jgi:hypothetical protein